MQTINRHNFAQLDAILWDRHDDLLTAKEALHVYETRWRYVDSEAMSESERALLDKLIASEGQGVFLV